MNDITAKPQEDQIIRVQKTSAMKADNSRTINALRKVKVETAGSGGGTLSSKFRKALDHIIDTALDFQ